MTMASVGAVWAHNLSREYRQHTQSPYAWRKFIKSEMARWRDIVARSPRQSDDAFCAQVNLAVFEPMQRVTDRACRRRDRELRRSVRR
jgi:hypothetical protein